MKSKLTLAVLLAVLPTIINASPLNEILNKRRLAAAPDSAHLEKCTDFSGTWKGVCTVDNQTNDNQTVIFQQKCEAIVSDSQYLPIGGLKGENYAAPGDAGSLTASSFSTTSEWNKTKTELNLNYAGQFKIGRTDSVALSGKGNMKIRDGKLEMSATVLNTVALCVYDRQ